jgi:large subunit ribosomal protein L29
MKTKEIRDLSVDELKQKEQDLVDEFFRLKVRRATGQLDSSAMMKNVRKDIARIKTVLKEREIRG